MVSSAECRLLFPRRLKCVSSPPSSRPLRLWLPYRHRQPRTQTCKTGSRSVLPCPSGWVTKLAGMAGLNRSGATGAAIGGGAPVFRTDDLAPLPRRLNGMGDRSRTHLPSCLRLRGGGLGRRVRYGVPQRRQRRHCARHCLRRPSDQCRLDFRRWPPSYWLRSPAIAPLMQVAIVPETIERRPSSVISRRRSGTIAPSPPTRMPSEPKLAKPQSA